jgi:hypothetical protein
VNLPETIVDKRAKCRGIFFTVNQGRQQLQQVSRQNSSRQYLETKIKLNIDYGILKKE